MWVQVGQAQTQVKKFTPLQQPHGPGSSNHKSEMLKIASYPEPTGSVTFNLKS